jgi:hypothetical protein
MNGPSFVAGYALAHSIDFRRQHSSIQYFGTSAIAAPTAPRSLGKYKEAE